MDEAEHQRRLQISLRLKAARHLAGYLGKKGVTPMPVEELARMPQVLDENISANKLTEVEQMRTVLKRSELEAIEEALALPDWFSGLHPSDRGLAVTDSLGAVVQGLREVVQSRRPEEAGDHSSSPSSDRRRRGAGGDA